MKPGDSLPAIIISLICFAITGFCIWKMLVLLWKMLVLLWQLLPI